MRKLFLCTCLFSTIVNGQPVINLFPYPAEIKLEESNYQVKNKLAVFAAFPKKESENLVGYLQQELKKKNIELTEVKDEGKADIVLFPLRMPTGGSLAYELKVNEEGIRLNANFAESAFHGIQTLLQLIPDSQVHIPCLKIFDFPRFEYRGMHLDVSRHFFPVSFIKRYIDYLAYQKFNSFHWHLTDDQGWRIEIKKYPKLTSVGGWRNGTLIGRYPGSGNDNIPYGGFYTQDEIREVVEYARKRFITVIPEIEMPAHSSAAIAAYPELSCFPGKPTSIPAGMISEKSIAEQKAGKIKLVQETWGIFEDVFCAGKDNTFRFLENVLDEVMELFPSEIIHVGGDECLKTNWKRCPDCQERMRRNHLKNEEQLQSYFMHRVEAYLNKKGRTMLGWDEILEGGLAPNAWVMSWRGEKGGIEAAKMKHKVIMSPGNPVYFDHTQSVNEDSVTIGGFNPLEKVYAYDPVPGSLSREEAKYIVGAQANVWAEYIKNTSKVEYTIFPRMSALAEVLWTPKENRNWTHFEKRLPAIFKTYQQWGANYSTAYYELIGEVIPSTDSTSKLMWKLSTRNKDARIVWQKTLTMDDPPNPPPFNEYAGPVEIAKSGEYRGWTFVGGKPTAPVKQVFHINSATGKPVTLARPASPTYPGDGPFTLVNGVINEKALDRSREFLGFSGTDCEATIDLGSLQPVSFVVVNSLQQRASWIWPPRAAEVYGSSDGREFYPLGSTTIFNESGKRKGTMVVAFRSTHARYIKVIVKNQGIIPEGNPGAGKAAWLFVDEIEVDGPKD